MKFVFADSLDFVDPRYDFIEDRSPPDREYYWDDQYPHELLKKAPYDGILVSRAIVGSSSVGGKYTDSQAMRFRRVGAREFLRFPEEKFPNSIVMGDCGAFSYHKQFEPPYSVTDMVEFYADGKFTHGCSIDHIIFDFFDFDAEQEETYVLTGSDEYVENKRRLDITLGNADAFFVESQKISNNFTPVGVVQGWSPLSMADAANKLVDMGYTYLAIGGMASLKTYQIQKVLKAIRSTIGDSISIHVLGFAKADDIQDFVEHNITSFDTTSPLIRAFKDGRNNYYLPGEGGKLKYYSAVRVPQALDNNKLKNLVREGVYSQEDLQKRERNALDCLRAYDRSEVDLHQAWAAVMDYSAPILIGRDAGHSDKEKKCLYELGERMRRTLSQMPWKSCSCEICKNLGIEVIVFRSSNRNKRRGFHNLYVYGNHTHTLRGSD